MIPCSRPKLVKIYKDWFIAKDKEDNYYCYIPDEWLNHWQLRIAEYKCQSIKECEENIDSSWVNINY